MSTELVMPSNHFILCHPLLLLPSIFPSISVFSKKSALASGGQSIGASALASVPPMNIQNWFPLWLTGLISLHPRDSSKKTLKSVLQYRNSKASVFQCSAFLMFQLSHPYMTTGKTIALTLWTFVGKVMSLLFNTLSRFAIAFSSKGSPRGSAGKESPAMWETWVWSLGCKDPLEKGQATHSSILA